MSIENDDQTAARMGQFLHRAGIDYRDVVPWNAYPWYINVNPTAVQLRAGIEPLRDLIGLMPHLRVVRVHGAAAEKGWKLLLRDHLDLVEHEESPGSLRITRVARRSRPPTRSSGGTEKRTSEIPVPRRPP